MSCRLYSPSSFLQTRRREPTFYRNHVLLTTSWIIDASDLLTRPKHSYSLSTLKSLAASQPVEAGLFVLEEQKRGVKNRGRKRLSPLSQPSLISLLFSLSGWYVSGPHRNSSVAVCAVDEGGFRWDVWQGGNRQRRYLRNAFSSSPLWGRSWRKSAKASRLAVLQKSARIPPAFRCL